MDVKTLARLSGNNPDSVVDCTPFDGGYLLKIDKKRNVGVQSEASREGDQFKTDFLLDGSPRTFLPERVTAVRHMQWPDPDDQIIRPAWQVRARAYPPNSLFGMPMEWVTFLAFQHQQGEFDLVMDQAPALPNAIYSLIWGTAELQFEIIALTTAGRLEIQHELQGPNIVRISARFSDVKFRMRNLHEFIEQTPDRPFDVELPSGSYTMTGTW